MALMPASMTEPHSSASLTLELTLPIPTDWQDVVVALLADLEFEGFVQEDDLLKAYLPAPSWNADHKAAVTDCLRKYGSQTAFEERAIPAQNWNQAWEQSIHPLPVGRFLIKPSWASLPPGQDDKIVLVIDPKMSFGTGYHESTRLILRVLPALVTGGEQVLDAGTGTGILAIAALKLGAATALTFDIDPWVEENVLENFERNEVTDRATYRTGALDVVLETGFDLVLANINRNVLIDMMPGLVERLRPGGHLVLAGLLREDRPEMLGHTAAHKLETERESVEGTWWSVVLRKVPPAPISP